MRACEYFSDKSGVVGEASALAYAEEGESNLKSSEVERKDSKIKVEKPLKLFKYVIAHTFKDGTIEEFEIETEKNLDIEKDGAYLEKVIAQFRQRAGTNELSVDDQIKSLKHEAEVINVIVEGAYEQTGRMSAIKNMASKV